MEEEASEEEEEVEDILKSGAQPQWHERQRVWQALGLFVGSAGGLAALTGAQPLLVGLFNSALSSSSTIVALAAVNPVAALGWTVGGAAAIALGAKMWHRRCYNDPEAVRVYYADFCRAGFLAAVARHDFDNLLRIATREGMTTKLLEEMAAAPYAGFDAVWHAYGAAHLTQMVDKRVLTRDYLRAKLARDFDPELAHTMPDDGVLVVVDLMRGMKTYGRWVVEWLEVSPAWIRHRFAHDARVCGLSFSQFVKEGGMALHPTAGATRLISRVQLRDMFFRELGHKEWTFKNIKELCAPWLFAADRADQEWTEDQEDEANMYPARSLVKPEELAELFHDEIARLELCDLLDLYWDWPLSRFVKRLVPDAELVSKLRLFQARYESTTKADAEERRKLREHFNKEKSVAERIYDTKIRAAQRDYREVEAKYAAKLKPAKEAKKDGPTMMEIDGDKPTTTTTTTSSSMKEEEEKKLSPEEVAERKKAKRKMERAQMRKTSAVEAATLERGMLVAMLERDRDDRLRAVADRLREEKARLNREWQEQRERHLHQASHPTLHFPVFPPVHVTPIAVPVMAVPPSAPPLEEEQTYFY